MKHVLFLSVLLVALFVSACTAPTQTPNSSTTAISAVKGSQPVLAEIARLSSLAAKHNITVQDFAMLQSLVKDDDHASGEVNETIVMVKYQEYEHAGHGLSFLGSYITTGKPILCPGHSVLHYYIYMKHNETDLAADQLQEAKDSFAQWLPKARAYDQQYPSGQDFNATVARIQSDIAQIDAGSTTASDDEIKFLDGAGSLCVENT